VLVPAWIFLIATSGKHMSTVPNLRPATREEIADALSFALRFDGRRPFPQSSSLMAQITAAHLVEHLERCGFVLMKNPDAVAPSASHHMRTPERNQDMP
jgi:hypothetical protein